jgi:hypothetical protein
MWPTSDRRDAAQFTVTGASSLGPLLNMDEDNVSTLPPHLGEHPPWPALVRYLVVVTQAVLGRPTLIHRGNRRVVWRQADVLHSVTISPYTWPDSTTPSAPRSVRFNVNYLDLDLDDWLTKKRRSTLGFEGSATAVPRGDRLQWTVMPAEAEATIPWLLSLVEARHRGDAELEAPPYPSETWEAPLRHVTYGWSTAAWRAVDEYDRQYPLGGRPKAGHP